MRPLLPIALFLTTLPAAASAASFDCSRARASDERTVCASRALNDRDVEMSVLYGLDLRFVPMGSRDVIRRDQAAWLKRRARCGANPACLARAYDRRIAELRAVIDTRVYPRGPF
ncbi:lysozyme inhibitor LprI family protein [Sphingomonadaceae bacterium G21617-S1]|nr:lysozyme inhibitor LprI family protein [Sphingomonadaceae bacterium G21617-S1]